MEANSSGELVIVVVLLFAAFFTDRAVGRERRAEAKRVNFALAAARVGVWEWDLHSDRVTWSGTTALAFGLDAEHAPTTGTRFFELVHPDDRPAVSRACDEAIRDRTELLTQFRATASDGSLRWIQANGHVTYDIQGKASRLLGVNTDVSDLKLLQERVRDAERQADRLRTLKATMLTVHDIVNNALMNLQLFRFEAEERDRALRPQGAHPRAARELESLGHHHADLRGQVAGGAADDGGAGALSRR